MDAPEPHPWTEAIDVLLRWRRRVILWLGIAWALILLGVLVLPRTYVCEATVALPNVAYVEQRPQEGQPERTVKPGVPIGLYKKLESSIADAALLEAAFRERLSPQQIRNLQRSITQVVGPVTSGARNEIVRTERDDTVTGVRLGYADTEEKRAEMVITTLAMLVKNEAAALIAEDRIESAVLVATATAHTALVKKVDLDVRSESLRALAIDLQKLTSLAPSVGDARREVVTVEGGGYRYLPPQVQLIGAKALEADYAHEMRLAQWTYRTESLRVAYFRRLDAKLRELRLRADNRVNEDLPSLMDAEVRAFLKNHESPEGDSLRAEIEGLRDVIQSHRANTAFVQRPSKRAQSRAGWIVAALVASALAVFLGVLMGESWRRYHKVEVPIAA